MKNILQRGNPFNLEQPKGIMNIVTGAILEKNEEYFLMNCISLGKTARIISRFGQPLPVEIDRFWFASKNKTALQQLFTKWVLNKVKSEQFDKSLFLGGSYKEKDAMCVSIFNGLVSVERLLECIYEEAEDRIFFHENHTIKFGNYGRVINASPDTDVFVSALHNICKLKYFDLEELRFVSGRGNSRTFFPIQDLANDLDSDLVEVLPAIHAVTIFDTASKVGTKNRAVREGAGC